MSEPELIPYFQSLNRQKRICPKCKSAPLRIEPTLNPKIGCERCDKCGFIHGIEAPEAAIVPTKKRSNVIKVNFR